jgi:DNA repair exonuclease SbcCD ATPase subunit
MSEDSRDRFGDKIHTLQKAREDQWARQQDEELIEQMRHRHAGMKCPECGEPLDPEAEIGLGAMVCLKHHGIWLDWDMLQKVRHLLIDKELHRKPQT